MGRGENGGLNRTEKTKRYSREEILVDDVVRTLRKRSKLIFVGTVLIGLLVGLASFLSPDRYRISLKVRPGIIRMGTNFVPFQIENPENTKLLVESRRFKKKVRKELERTGKELPKSPLKLAVRIPKGSDIVTISYETSHPDKGTEMMSVVRSLLEEEYARRVAYFKDACASIIRTKRIDLKAYQIRMESAAKYINLVKQRIDVLNSRVGSLKREVEAFRNNETMAPAGVSPEERNTFVSLMRAQTMQIFLILSNAYESELQKKKEELDRDSSDQERFRMEITKLESEIQDVESAKAGIKGIVVWQPPAKKRYPFFLKEGIIVVFGVIAGFFFLCLVAFFLEIPGRNKEG